MNKLARIFLVIALALLYLFFVKEALAFFAADYLDHKAQIYLSNGFLSDANSLAKDSIKLNKSEPAYHRNRALIYIATTLADGLSEDDKQLLKSLALEEAKKAYELQPYNIVNLKSLIQIYYYISVEDISKIETPTFSEQYKSEALNFYTKIENTAENDASIALALGKQYRLLEENDKARAMLAKAFELKPNLTEAKEELDLLKNQTN